MTEKSWTVHRR